MKNKTQTTTRKIKVVGLSEKEVLQRRVLARLDELYDGKGYGTLKVTMQKRKNIKIHVDDIEEVDFSETL